jgi:hypothetical protein
VPRPVAFMVMPFDQKRTGVEHTTAPPQVDFDALWHRVHVPVLSELGYHPVRADQDVGALIVVEMIQRLAIADLVVADVSLPNANVYYEIGIRHAARRVGCVLVAASWAQPVFDLRQMRQLRYPLDDGDVGDDAAGAARRALAEGMRSLIDGESPVFSAVPGYPAPAREASVTAFRNSIDELAAFDAEVRAVRLAPVAQQGERALAIVQRRGRQPVLREAVVLELIRLLRDHVGFAELVDYIDQLPEHLRRHPLVVEQRCIGLAKAGDPAAAAAILEQLIEREGGTSERWGLLGGRYKQLWATAPTEGERRRFLDAAIGAYEHGMLLDLNDYYPASNLPRLYRARGGRRDAERAADAQAVTAAACERAVKLGTADEWVRPTLLGLAFERGDVDKASQLRDEVEADGVKAWMKRTTLDDLRRSTAHHPQPVRAQLEVVLGELDDLAGAPSR